MGIANGYLSVGAIHFFSFLILYTKILLQKIKKALKKFYLKKQNQNVVCNPNLSFEIIFILCAPILKTFLSLP